MNLPTLLRNLSRRAASQAMHRYSFDITPGEILKLRGDSKCDCLRGLIWLTPSWQPIDVVLASGRQWTGDRRRSTAYAFALAGTTVDVWSAERPELIPAPRGFPAQAYEERFGRRRLAKAPDSDRAAGPTGGWGADVAFS